MDAPPTDPPESHSKKFSTNFWQIDEKFLFLSPESPETAIKLVFCYWFVTQVACGMGFLSINKGSLVEYVTFGDNL